MLIFYSYVSLPEGKHYAKPVPDLIFLKGYLNI